MEQQDYAYRPIEPSVFFGWEPVEAFWLLSLRGDRWQFSYELFQDCWATHEEAELRLISAEIVLRGEYLRDLPDGFQRRRIVSIRCLPRSEFWLLRADDSELPRVREMTVTDC